MSSPNRKTPPTELNNANTLDELDQMRQSLLAELEHFHDIRSNDDLQKRYMTLAKKLHPDAGGTDTAFADLRNERDQWLAIEGTYMQLRSQMEKYPDVFSVAVTKPTVKVAPFGDRVRKNLSKKETRRKLSKAAGVIVGELAQATIDGLLRKK